MLTRETQREINEIAERAIRNNIITKHHRFILTTALQQMKEKRPDLDLSALTDEEIRRIAFRSRGNVIT